MSPPVSCWMSLLFEISRLLLSEAFNCPYEEESAQCRSKPRDEYLRPVLPPTSPPSDNCVSEVKN
jgi:hypothetical protein